MIQIGVPGLGPLSLSALVLDMNGTISLDGKLLEGVEERIARLSGLLDVHLATSDTFGTARELADQLRVSLHRLEPNGMEAMQKARLVRRLQAEGVVAVGNGCNDTAMLREAAVGIAVIGPEGCAREALEAADIVAPSITWALDLLLNPRRLAATLRR